MPQAWVGGEKGGGVRERAAPNQHRKQERAGAPGRARAVGKDHGCPGALAGVFKGVDRGAEKASVAAREAGTAAAQTPVNARTSGGAHWQGDARMARLRTSGVGKAHPCTRPRKKGEQGPGTTSKKKRRIQQNETTDTEHIQR